MPVVYNGVPGSGQGDLFEGLKLWVAHRVPQRDRMIDLVKGNGGEIVKLEKNADMMIVDHMKRAGGRPPPGSYSWQWIDTSVKNGFLEDKDDYLAARAKGTPREAGASEKTKLGRTPFSKLDDRVLTKWVMAEESLQNPTSGNAIYHALEKKHPQHTWQSWRDRWVKILSNRPRLAIPDDELQAEVEEHRAESPDAAAEPSTSRRRAQPSRAGKSPTRPAEPLPGPSTPQHRAPEPAAPPRSGSAQGKGRMFFSEMEDQLLLAYIGEKREKNRNAGLNENKDLSGNVIYKSFAEMHPDRTWQAWRDRWVRHLSLIEAVDDAGPDEASNAKPEGTHTRRPRGRPRKHVVVPASAGPASPNPGPSFTQQQPEPDIVDAEFDKKGKGKEANKAPAAAEAHAATLIAKTWKGHASRKNLANLEGVVLDLQSLYRGYVVRMKVAVAAEVTESHNEPAVYEAEQDSEQFEDARETFHDADMALSRSQNPEDLSPRQQFFKDLEDIIEATAIEVNMTPTIDGGEIDLWDLYSIATQQQCEPEQRDWKLVTEGLGLEPTRSLVRKVQACYLQNLADFEDHMQAFEGEGFEDEEETAEDDGQGVGDGEEGVDESDEVTRDAGREGDAPRTSDAVTAPNQPLADPSSPAFCSSPPAVRSKRSFRQTGLRTSDSAYPSSGPRKRRRVEKTSVVPPTPEDRLGLHGDSHDRDVWQLDSSPLKQQALPNGTTIDIGSGDELFYEDMTDIEGAAELPTLGEPNKKKFVEPETQDWDMEQDHRYFDDEGDASPSQQLLQESDAVQSPGFYTHNRSPVASKAQRTLSSAAHPRDSANPTARALRSAPQPATSSSGPRNSGKTTKRTLPAKYNRNPAAVPDSALEQPKKAAHLPPQPQLKKKGTAYLSKPAPARAATASTSRPTKPNTATLTTPATRSLPISAQGPPAAVPQNRSNSTRQHSVQGSLPSDGINADYVDAEVSHFQSLGYKLGEIKEAMKVATMERGPMIVVLESIHKGHGIPQYESGVWTPQDCSDLRLIKKHERQALKGKHVADEQEMSRWKVKEWELNKKHGQKRVETRWNFMELSGETGET